MQIVAPRSNPGGQVEHFSVPSHVAQLAWQAEQIEVEPLMSWKNLASQMQDPFYNVEFGAQIEH